MKIETIWKIRADRGNHQYNMPTLVGKTLYRWLYTLYRDSYQLYWRDMLTCTQCSLQFQFLTMISHICSHLAHFCPELYHHLSRWDWVIALDLSMPGSAVNTEYTILCVLHTPRKANAEYSKHRVQYTPSTAYTEYCIPSVLHPSKMDCLLLPGCLSSLSGPCCTQCSKFAQLYVTQWIESQLPLHLPLDHKPPDWPLTCTPAISHNYGLQLHLQFQSITTCMFIP